MSATVFAASRADSGNCGFGARATAATSPRIRRENERGLGVFHACLVSGLYPIQDTGRRLGFQAYPPDGTEVRSCMANSEPRRGSSCAGCGPDCSASCRASSCPDCSRGCLAGYSTRCCPSCSPRCSVRCSPGCSDDCGPSSPTGCRPRSSPWCSDRCPRNRLESCRPYCSAICSVDGVPNSKLGCCRIRLTTNREVPRCLDEKVPEPRIRSR